MAMGAPLSIQRTRGSSRCDLVTCLCIILTYPLTRPKAIRWADPSFLSLLQNCSELLHLPKETVKPSSHHWNSFPIRTSLLLKSHFKKKKKKKAWQCHIRVWVESRITEALKNGTNFLGIKLAKPFLFFLISLCELTCHSEGGSRSFFTLTYLHWKLKRGPG